MSATYFSYSGFVGGNNFVFDSKCIKNDGWISFKAVPVDPPAHEPNNLTVADNANYPTFNIIVDRFGITEGRSSGEGRAADGKGFMSGVEHLQDSEWRYGLFN